MNKTCHYCSQNATQNVVWLRNKSGDPARVVLPHCGCDLMAALRKLWPNPYRIRLGEDYIIEPLPENLHHTVSGDGLSVTVNLLRSDGTWVNATLPKLAARKLAQDIRDAAGKAEPGCDDATDHWHGHCGCK